MTNTHVPNISGIYIVTITSETPMPVTRDSRYIETCAKVNKYNVKIGKANNLAARRLNYWKDFGKENIRFNPLITLKNTQKAETIILRHLKKYRLRSPKGGLLEWLENINEQKAINEIYSILKKENIEYTVINPNKKDNNDN